MEQINLGLLSGQLPLPQQAPRQLSHFTQLLTLILLPENHSSILDNDVELDSLVLLLTALHAEGALALHNVLDVQGHKSEQGVN